LPPPRCGPTDAGDFTDPIRRSPLSVSRRSKNQILQQHSAGGKPQPASLAPVLTALRIRMPFFRVRRRTRTTPPR